MVDRISGLTSSLPRPPENPDHILLAKEIKVPLKSFIDSLNDQNRDLFCNPDFLNNFASSLRDLHALSAKALNL